MAIALLPCYTLKILERFRKSLPGDRIRPPSLKLVSGAHPTHSRHPRRTIAGKSIADNVVPSMISLTR